MGPFCREKIGSLAPSGDDGLGAMRSEVLDVRTGQVGGAQPGNPDVVFVSVEAELSAHLRFSIRPQELHPVRFKLSVSLINYKTVLFF